MFFNVNEQEYIRSVPRIDLSFTVSESEAALLELSSNCIATSEMAFVNRLKRGVILKSSVMTGGKREPNSMKSWKDCVLSLSCKELNPS